MAGTGFADVRLQHKAVGCGVTRPGIQALDDFNRFAVAATQCHRPRFENIAETDKHDFPVAQRLDGGQRHGDRHFGFVLHHVDADEQSRPPALVGIAQRDPRLCCPALFANQRTDMGNHAVGFGAKGRGPDPDFLPDLYAVQVGGIDGHVGPDRGQIGDDVHARVGTDSLAGGDFFLDYHAVDGGADIQTGEPLQVLPLQRVACESQSDEFLFGVALRDLGLRQRLPAGEVILFRGNFFFPQLFLALECGAGHGQALLRSQILAFEVAEFLALDDGQHIAAPDRVAKIFDDTGDDATQSRHYADDAILIELDFALQLQR